MITSDLKAIYMLWLRDLKRYWYDKPRIVASLGQPILFLFVLGTALSPSFKGPSGINFSEFIFPGIVAMTVLFTSIFSAMSIVWDREFGFLKEVLVAPISRWAIVIGKALGGSTVATLQGTLMLALAPIVGIRFSLLSLPLIFASMFLVALTMTSFGIVLAARMKEMEGFQVIVNFLIMPIFFLSGALFPLNNLPGWLSALTKIDPLTYGVDLMRGIIIKTHTFSTLTDQTMIAAFGVVMMAIAVFEFNISE